MHACDTRLPVAQLGGLMWWDDTEQPGRLTVVLPPAQRRVDVIYLFEHFADVSNSDRALGPGVIWLVQLLAIRDLDLLVRTVYIHMDSIATTIVITLHMNRHPSSPLLHHANDGMHICGYIPSIHTWHLVQWS